MESIYESNMLYPEEHIACSDYLCDVKHGFRYREYSKGTRIARESSYANVIMFVLSGSMKVNCMLYPEKIVSDNEMFLISVNSFFDIECIENTTAIALVFEKWNFHCCSTPFASLKPYSIGSENVLSTLDINPQLRQFLDLMTMYLRNGVNCCHLHHIKCDEFFVLIRHFYSKENLAFFFYPMLSHTMDFRMFCFRMVNQVRDVSSLVNESGMSRSAFYKKFTEEFGDISPKRWLDQYFEQRILYASSIPGTSAKELAFKMGFGDESSFTQYCKRHFGKVPSDLVKERGGVLKDI